MGHKTTALRAAAKQFRFYEQLHRQKGTPDGDKKALANRNLAQMMEMALEIPGDFAIGSDVWPGLGKLVEEMGENAQNLGKLVGLGGDNTLHWDGQNLPHRIELELGDLLGVIDFFLQANQDKLNVQAILDRRNEKSSLFRAWHNKTPKPPEVTEEFKEGPHITSLLRLPSSTVVQATWSDGYKNSLDLRNYSGEDEQTIRARLEQLRVMGQPSS